MGYCTNPGKDSFFDVAYKYIDFLLPIFTYYAKRFGLIIQKLVCIKKCCFKVEFEAYTVLFLTGFAGLMEMGVCFCSYMQSYISFKFILNELLCEYWPYFLDLLEFGILGDIV